METVGKQSLHTQSKHMVQINSIEVRATNMINELKEAFINDRFYFDSLVAQRVSGDYNKALRQEIIRQVTRERKPLSKCGMYAVADVLTASFTQYQLFAQATTTQPVKQPLNTSRAWFDFLAL